MPVTSSEPKPGDFPLHSPQSRAAARMLSERKENGAERLTIIVPGWWALVHGEKKNLPWASPWVQSLKDGAFVRTLVVPDGMTAEEAERIVDRMGD